MSLLSAYGQENKCFGFCVMPQQKPDVPSKQAIHLHGVDTLRVYCVDPPQSSNDDIIRT